MLALAVTVAACAGSIDNPGDYSFPGSARCDAPSQVLVPRCGGCHSAATALGGLDLASAGLAARLTGAAAQCSGQVLIVPGDPDTSYLMQKLSEATPACGNAMPLGGRLPAADLACVARWIEGLAPVGATSPE
jgi:hypothetical protein